MTPIQSTAPSASAEELALIARAFAADVGRRDIHQLLAYLNGLVTHRFTGVYRFEPGWVVSVALYDREAPDLQVGSDVKMRESYCWLTGLGGSFVIEDATADARLCSHAARDAVRSYTALVLRDRAGAPWGTLCHYDFEPRPADPSALAGLERARPLVEELVVRDGHACWEPDAPSRERRAVPEPLVSTNGLVS